ncbi:MAG: hypothetical protein CVT48_02300 [Thermoplasmata archaeon HGW-Thermoplasmata-1]|nr:MAG: hypothetical protein CVT48_02300 [Thermoplasmata archaeon HGW-Thermoplasmata-1]
MDVMDAGVYVYAYEADTQDKLKAVLWGPLQAKEMGFSGWDYQDGGETGFIYHNVGAAVKMGRATSTLIVSNRLKKAFLTIYLGGYPSDAPEQQRSIDVQSVVNEAELFLTRLSKKRISFAMTAKKALVDNRSEPVSKAAPSPEHVSFSPNAVSADKTAVRHAKSEKDSSSDLWEV